jgi:hypothetical protein
VACTILMIAIANGTGQNWAPTRYGLDPHSCPERKRPE